MDSPPPFAPCSYAVAVRFGELIEEIEYDDWNLPVDGEEQGLPSWCRAAFAMEAGYDDFNAREHHEGGCAVPCSSVLGWAVPCRAGLGWAGAHLFGSVLELAMEAGYGDFNARE